MPAKSSATETVRDALRTRRRFDARVSPLTDTFCGSERHSLARIRSKGSCSCLRGISLKIFRKKLRVPADAGKQDFFTRERHARAARKRATAGATIRRTSS